ncbi:unnamed protein product, partial [Ascophyllum nodosum]
DVPAERIESLLSSAFTAPLFYPRDDRTRRWRALVLCGMAKLFVSFRIHRGDLSCNLRHGGPEICLLIVGVGSGARGCKAGCSELSDASTFQDAPPCSTLLPLELVKLAKQRKWLQSKEIRTSRA